MEQFGKYTLIRKIGTGGMAEVFLARTTVAQGLNKTLVIKKIHTAYARSRQFVTMFVDEAKIALGLNHPNIIQVFDFGAVGDTYFLAMEYVEGLDLLRLLQEAAKAQASACRTGCRAYIVQQLAKGLDYAHRKTDDFGQPLGIVHRDISPQNVLLSWDGGVKIVDFGIARARDVHEEQGVIKGKFAYMSPEQARGEPVDCRSDVFAAGIVLYELVCARPLFHGKGKEALEMVKSGAIPRPRDFAPELPESLERIILRALAFHRADRFQTARDLQHELGKFQLEWGAEGRRADRLGPLAQQLAQLVPPERAWSRRARRAEGDAARRRRSHDDAAAPRRVAANAERPRSARADACRAATAARRRTRDARPPTPRADRRGAARPARAQVRLRARRASCAAWRRSSSGSARAGAARLVNEFYKVARDVAFKHDALLDVPKLPADGKDVPIGVAELAPGTTGGETIVRLVVGLAGRERGRRRPRDPARARAGRRARRHRLATSSPSCGSRSRCSAASRWSTRAANGAAGDGARVRDRGRDRGVRAQARAAGARRRDPGRRSRVSRGARRVDFEALPAIDLPDDRLGAHRQRGRRPTRTPIRASSARGCTGCAAPRSARSGCASAAIAGRLHGRDLELKALRDAWRDVLVTRAQAPDRDRRRRRRRQAHAGAHVPRGRRARARRSSSARTARVGTAMTPYGVIADLARDVLGLAEDAEPHEVERRLLRALPLIYPGAASDESREARTALQIFGMLLGARRRRPAAEVDADDAAPDAAADRCMRIEQPARGRQAGDPRRRGHPLGRSGQPGAVRARCSRSTRRGRCSA